MQVFFHIYNQTVPGKMALDQKRLLPLMSVRDRLSFSKAYMQSDKLITRRATVDDLPQLITLWKSAYLPADIFEKRLTEFHIVEDPHSKKILAAIGLHSQESAVMLHSEVFGDPANEDLYRDMLWPRFKTLARSLGASRIWTQETASFWKREGFRLADEEVLKKRPHFPDGEEHLPWCFIQIFDEEKVEQAMGEHRYDALLQLQKDESDAYAQQMRVLRNVIITLGIVLIGTMLIMFLYSFASSYR